MPLIADAILFMSNKVGPQKCKTNLSVCLIVALHPSQQLWSCRDVLSILLDFYPKEGCHPNSALKIFMMDGLT